MRRDAVPLAKIPGLLDALLQIVGAIPLSLFFILYFFFFRFFYIIRFSLMWYCEVFVNLFS